VSLERSSRQSNFKEQNLLIVDKKKKFVPSKDQFSTEEEGVLSIPPEDPPSKCKSKYTTIPR